MPLSITKYGFEGERVQERAEAVNVADATAARTLTAKKGSLEDLRGNTLALSDSYVFDSGLGLGDKVKVGFEDGEPVTLKIVAIVHAAPSLHGGMLVSADLAKQHDSGAMPDRMFVIPNDGVSVADIRQELAGTDVQVDTATTWIDATDKDMRKNNQLSLWIVLGPAGFYAALAIANTLLMGSLQRRRELVSTLLIGATKPQVRAMVLWESAIVTAAALTLGGVITAIVGILMRGSLSDGLASMPIHVPWESLSMIAVVCLAIAAAAALAPTPSMLKRVHPSQAAD